MQFNNFSELVKAYRTKHGLTQQMLAEEGGISVDAIKAWESGRREPSCSCLKQVFGGDTEFYLSAISLRAVLHGEDIPGPGLTVDVSLEPESYQGITAAISDMDYPEEPYRINYSDSAYNDFYSHYMTEKKQRKQSELSYINKMGLSEEEANEIETAISLLFDEEGMSVFRYAVPYATARYTLIGKETELLSFFKGKAKHYPMGTDEFESHMREAIKVIFDMYLTCISDDASYSDIYRCVSRYKSWRGIESNFRYTAKDLPSHPLSDPEFIDDIDEYKKVLRESSPKFEQMYQTFSGFMGFPPKMTVSLLDIYTICRIAASWDDNRLLVANGEKSPYGADDDREFISADSFRDPDSFNRCPVSMSAWGYCHRSYEYFPNTITRIMKRLVEKEESKESCTVKRQVKRKWTEEDVTRYTVSLKLTPAGVGFIKWFERIFAPLKRGDGTYVIP